jgi:hypothetical protein
LNFVVKTDDLIVGLPGERLVRQGLTDLRRDRCTIAACLVAIARPRLARAGLMGDGETQSLAEPELQLYRLLRYQDGDAYSRYNSLLRELVSFEMALDRRTRVATTKGAAHP